MSYPPHQGPPPYQGYPPGAFAYVPAPVMMPYPPPPPGASNPSATYITNHYIYQPPPDPVQVVENAEPVPPPDVIEWEAVSPSTASTLTGRALVGGKEGWDGSPLWVIRAHHIGEYIPGKLAIKHQTAFIPHGGVEVPVHHFEVLCTPAHAVRWIPANNGQVPVGAVIGGNGEGEPLYIGRVRHRGSLTPGKFEGCGSWDARNYEANILVLRNSNATVTDLLRFSPLIIAVIYLLVVRNCLLNITKSYAEFLN